MKFKGLYLDTTLLSQLGHLAVNEGFVKRYKGDFPSFDLYRKPRRLYNKSDLLLYITLFENIEGEDTMFDFTGLLNEGIINSNSNLVLDDETRSNLFVTEYGSNDFKKLNPVDKEIAELSWLSADKILALNQNRISSHILRTFSHEAPSDLNHYQIPSKKELYNKLPLLFDFPGEINDDDEYWHQKLPNNSFWDDARSQIEGLESNLSHILFHSIKNKMPFTSIFNFNKEHEYKKKVVEDAVYIVRAFLPQENIVFPFPRTLTEAIKLRDQKELIRFRQLLSEWLTYLETGASVPEQKIRKEIIRANREMRNLKYWREYKSSPIDFWINSIGGHIPILGSVLNVISTLGYVYEKHTESKHGWIKIMKH